MTISFYEATSEDVELTLENLKVLKNAVIGNPQAKKHIASDIVLVQKLIQSLNPDPEDEHSHLDATRTEAAHVLASIGYSSSPSLSTLFRTSALRSLLYAISRFTPNDSITLRAAFSRALRVIATSVADIVGPGQWGLQVEQLDGSLRAQAKDALDWILQTEALDVYLPLLVIGSGSPAIITSTASMIASVIRSPLHRRLMTEWVPPQERQREIKTRRGWEKAAAIGGPGAGIPWVAKKLLDVVLMTPQTDIKVLEACLLALSSLAKDNPPIASFIAKSADRESVPPLANILALIKLKSVDVQLAACLCIAHTLRAFPSHGSLSNAIYSSHYSSHTGHSASARPFWSHGDPYQTATSSISSRDFAVHLPASSWGPWGTNNTLITGTVLPLSPTAGPSHAPAPGSLHPTLPHLGSLPLEENCVRAVINVVNRIIVNGVPSDTYITASQNASTKTVGTAGGGANKSGTQSAADVVTDGGGLGPAPPSTKVIDSPLIRTKACFVLYYLVTDDVSLCHTAMDRGCVESLANLVWFINPPDPVAQPEWEEDEPEPISALREGALTALAALALAVDDIRKRISDDLKLLPCLSRALRCRTYPATPSSSPSSTPPLSPSVYSSSGIYEPYRYSRKYSKHVGPKYAACQVLRAVTRTLAIMRTTVNDCGLGMDILRIVLDEDVSNAAGIPNTAAATSGPGATSSAGNGGGSGPARIGGSGGLEGATRSGLGKGKEPSSRGDRMEVEGWGFEVKKKKMKEDRRVVSAALAAVCNIVNDFSPLRLTYLEEKIVPRLVYFLKESGDPSLRVNALWAIKNLVRNTSLETKKEIMKVLTWEELLKLLSDPDEDIQDQAFTILRNMCDHSESVQLVITNIPTHGLMSAIQAALHLPPSSPILYNASYLVSNLVNGTEEAQEAIMKHPGMLDALREALSEGGTPVRRALVHAISELVRSDMRRRRDLMKAGIVSTLKRVCEFPATMPVSSGVGRRGVSGERGGVGVVGGGGMSRTYSSGLVHDTYGGMGMGAGPSSPVENVGGSASASTSLGSGGGPMGRGRLASLVGGAGSGVGYMGGSVASGSTSTGGGYEHGHHGYAGGHGVGYSHSHSAIGGHSMGPPIMGGDDQDVVDAARIVLGWFEIQREVNM